jgi:L-ascorbate metabolism protein UlaG (beta-lactamase superfamily)
VVIDPYDHKAVGYGPLSLRGDIVTISYDDPGHNNFAVVKGRKRVITGPGEYEIGGVFITGVQIDEKKRNSGEARNTLYVFDYKGVTVAHLGNLRKVPNQTRIEALGEVNIALVPVGGGGGLTAAKAVEVISLFQPGIVVPMHYQTPKAKMDLAPVTKFLKEMGIGNVETEPSLNITRTGIPSDTRVVVLAHER